MISSTDKSVQNPVHFMGFMLTEQPDGTCAVALRGSSYVTVYESFDDARQSVAAMCQPETGEPEEEEE